MLILREHRVTERELRDDYILRSAIERNLQLAIESALDIGEMVISMEDLEKPETYRDIIEILEKHGILPSDFAERFSEAAGLRNILVHMYTDVDPSIITEILNKRLHDFEFYSESILRFLGDKYSYSDKRLK
ncbi:type VII toxin-antitoxin system HepT family RNase toxin [Methanothermobacter sp.]|uniref:type VII toxin-antitoxin system HepT family RNase toxin n=1 Tax=Methanothermobacter sp. TaxID=1884223 RepID=UPI003C721485